VKRARLTPAPKLRTPRATTPEALSVAKDETNMNSIPVSETHASTPIEITIYNGMYDTTPIASDTLTFAELGDELEALIAQPARAKAEMLAIGPHRLRDGTTRANANVERMGAVIALDVDKGLVDLDDLLDTIRGYGIGAIVYTSATDPNPDGSRRVRIFLLSEEHAPEQCWAVRKAAAELLGVTLDPQTKDASRLFFAGVLEGSEPRECYRIDGEPLALVLLDLTMPEPPRAKAVGGPLGAARASDNAATARAHALAERLEPSVEGHGGDESLFKAACEIATVLGEDADAIEAVLSESYNPRCAPPWPASKIKREAKRAAERQATPEARFSRRREAKREAANDNESFKPAADSPAAVPLFLCSRRSKLILIWENDELGHRPIILSMVRTRIRELGHEALCPIKEGKRDLSADKIVESNNASYVHTAYAFANTVTQYDPSGEGSVTIGYPLAPIVARYDADADAWLHALAGTHYDRLAVWIASCAQRHINRLSACLVLMGRADSGKSMFAHAVARMWGQTPPPLSLINVQFNADMLRCPILADEEAQLLGSRALSSNKFRDIIQGASRHVERKGEERCELIGALRAVVSCNAISDLRFTNLGGPTVIEALRDRLLVIDATARAEECKAPLARLRPPGDHLVDLERVAAHMAWLCETVELPADRFLGAGGDAGESAILAGHVEENIDVWETFRDWLEADGADGAWSAHHKHGLCVEPAALALSLENTGDGWSLRKVRSALAPFHTGDAQPGGDGVRRRVWVLDAARIAEALSLGLEDLDALGERLGERLNGGAAPPRSRFGKFVRKTP
jgi:hypothetical protein